VSIANRNSNALFCADDLGCVPLKLPSGTRWPTLSARGAEAQQCLPPNTRYYRQNSIDRLAHESVESAPARRTMTMALCLSCAPRVILQQSCWLEGRKPHGSVDHDLPIPQVPLESATPHTPLTAASPKRLPWYSQTPSVGEIDSRANYRLT
jgi:hypothetical protein